MLLLHRLPVYLFNYSHLPVIIETRIRNFSVTMSGRSSADSACGPWSPACARASSANALTQVKARKSVATKLLNASFAPTAPSAQDCI